MSLPVVVLTRSGVLRLRSRHPWIYPDHVASSEAADGELARLEGPPGRARGFAVWNGRSRLPLRVVAWDGGEDLSPAFWEQRLDLAVERRARNLAPGEAACRWVHAEADGLPGLVVDRYGGVAVLQAGCLWADRRAIPAARRLMERHGVTGVLARHDGAFRRPEGLVEEVVVLAGSVPEEVVLEIGGLARPLDLRRGQKTGAFLDQRLNQRWAAEVLPPGRCLDAFCHDGPFALQLAAAGSTVEALDSSGPALEQLERSARLNDLGGRIERRRVNVFDHLRRQGGEPETFDGIVLDPPALAKRKGDVPAARRAYKDLNLRALRLLRPGGRLISCSCSFHLGWEPFLEVVREAAADTGREVTLLERRQAAPCHPHLLTFPESAYLKVVLLEVR